jgi:hypothetical protein
MFTVINVSPFMNGSKLDKNGKPAVYLNYVSGTQLPQRARVLSGTIAESIGLATGNAYLIKCEITGEGEFGETFKHTKISDLHASDMIALYGSQINTVQAPIAEKAVQPNTAFSSQKS